MGIKCDVDCDIVLRCQFDFSSDCQLGQSFNAAVLRARSHFHSESLSAIWRVIKTSETELRACLGW